ncbi:MFS transporter [Mycobacterium sp. GA-1841]|uniref:MFS transporter n=1 Tax=Mycobacterium sp. GA-1841 TaxID=1834154 RepID=UPI00096CCA6C|nr:MFS transporter [Mycobacterium sp. GA-1841]OMC40838.1 MFS transporter [Mycobacterium sp. GA-1841]
MVNITAQSGDIHSSVLSGRSRIWLLVVCSMGVLLVISSMVALNAALGAIALETLATQSQLTWIVDGYTLVMACLLLPAGALGDRYGRRTVLLVGLVIFAVASLAPIYFDSPTALIIARGVTGIGAAAVLPATLSLLIAAYPEDQRNKVIGIWAGVCASSALVGFMGTAILTQFGPWQSIFWAFVAAAALLFVSALTISSSKDPEATPVDLWGALLIGSAVAVFVFGVIEAPLRGWSAPSVYGCLAGGVLLAVAFGFVELRRKHPLLDIRVFKRPDMLTGSIGMTTLFFAIFGFFFLIMQHLQLVLGYTPLQTAIALCPLAVPLLVFAALTGWYLPRFGLRISVAVGLATLAAGLLCMRLLDVDSSYFDLAWPMLVLSTGMGICNAPSTTAITGAVPLSKQGVASAINDTTRELGGALGIALAGSILAAGYNDALVRHVATLPETVREPALGSLAQALTIADRLGPAGGDLTSHAKAAFMQAMHSSLLMLGIVVLVSAIVVAIWAPGRDGQQIRVVRRFTAGRGEKPRSTTTARG